MEEVYCSIKNQIILIIYIFPSPYSQPKSMSHRTWFSNRGTLHLLSFSPKPILVSSSISHLAISSYSWDFLLLSLISAQQCIFESKLVTEIVPSLPLQGAKHLWSINISYIVMYFRNFCVMLCFLLINCILPGLGLLFQVKSPNIPSIRKPQKHTHTHTEFFSLDIPCYMFVSLFLVFFLNSLFI